MKVVVADVEADGLLDTISRIWCIALGDPSTEKVEVYTNRPGYKPLREALQIMKEADKVVFHNGLGYDLHAVNKIYPGALRFDQIVDTLVLSRLHDPESKYHSLADWGRKLGFEKGDHKDFSQWSEDMARYCKRDVALGIKIYKYLQRYFTHWTKKGVDWKPAIELEHQVAFIISLQEQHGFRFDVDKARELEIELREEKAQIERDLQQIFKPQYVPAKGIWTWDKRKWIQVEVTTPKVNNTTTGITKGVPYCKVAIQEFNPGSRQQITQRITQRYRWKPAKFTPTGAPQIDESVIAEMQFPEAKHLERYFAVDKMLGQLADGDNAWLKLYRETPEPRVFGRVNPNGCRTFRMSHFKPNMAQVSKKDKRMRQVWLPDISQKLVGADADGLELRMLAHYLFPWDKGAYAKAVVEGKKADKTDAHSKTQLVIGLYSRDSAKTYVYAFLYGAGNPKLGATIVEDAHNAGQPKPKGALATLGKESRRKIEVGIHGLQQLVSGCKKRHKERGYLIGLDGRPIQSASEHSSLNTLLQGGGAIVMKKALALFHFELSVQAGWVDPITYLPKPNTFSYCANVHDESQKSSNPEIAHQVGQTFADAITLAGVRLGLNVPLAGTFDVGENWADTH